jgi:hypothetical protein
LSGALANSVALKLMPLINKTFADSFTTTLLPAYERATHVMFQQIEAVFVQGVKQSICSKLLIL